MSISSPPKEVANWTPVVHEIFVELCLEETLKGNKPGTHFTRQGWRNIVASFRDRTGLSYDKVKLKSHWDRTKDQWKIWHKLIGTSDMKWDQDKNEFGADKESWDNYLKENPEAARFRCKKLPFADKLDMLFDGTIDIGEKVSANAIQGMKSNGNLTASTLQPEAATEHPRDPVESTGAVIFQKQRGFEKFELTYSIGECIDCLDGLEELEQGCDLYLFALDLFLRKEYREIFLQLKTPSVKISWLQHQQATKRG